MSGDPTGPAHGVAGRAAGPLGPVLPKPLKDVREVLDLVDQIHRSLAIGELVDPGTVRITQHGRRPAGEDST